jgi:hypothetical protein
MADPILVNLDYSDVPARGVSSNVADGDRGDSCSSGRSGLVGERESTGTALSRQFDVNGVFGFTARLKVGGVLRACTAVMSLIVCGVLTVAAGGSAAQPHPDFPMWCKGAAGMASTNGKNLIIQFTPAPKRAPEGLNPGQCSWLDRPLRPNEPTRIVSEQYSVSTARQVAGQINRGSEWTFWVFNAGKFLKGTASSQGTHREKPGIL